MDVDGLDWNSALESLLRHDVHEPVCVVNLENQSYRIVHVNEHWTATTGFLLQDVVGRPWSEMCGQLANSGDVQSINAAIEAGQSSAGRVVSYRKDGSTFLNCITVIPVGAIQVRGAPCRIAGLMMRELLLEATDEDWRQCHEQQLYAGVVVRGRLQQMSEHAASPHQGQAAQPAQAHNPNESSSQQPANAPPPLDIPNETLLLALQQDDYTNLRNFLLAWGEMAVDRFRKMPQLSCRLNQTGLDPSAVAQGGFCSGAPAGEGGGGRSRKQPQSAMLCKATVLQYALAYRAFKACALLLVCDPAIEDGERQCSLVMDLPKREMSLSTSELCALYARSLASTSPDLSNQYALAGFLCRHWLAIAPALGLDGQGGGVAQLAVEDGNVCIQKLEEAAMAHMGALSDRFVVAREQAER